MDSPNPKAHAVEISQVSTQQSCQPPEREPIEANPVDVSPPSVTPTTPDRSANSVLEQDRVPIDGDQGESRQAESREGQNGSEAINKASEEARSGATSGSLTVPPRTISPAKLHANHVNGSKSKGPRTERGKKRSRRNAITHGMFTSINLLEDEELAGLRQMELDCIDDCKPVGFFEHVLAEQVALDAWRRRRGACYELAAGWKQQQWWTSNGTEARRQLDKAYNAIPFGPCLDTLLRYTTTFQRQMERDIKLLSELQRERRKREEKD